MRILYDNARGQYKSILYKYEHLNDAAAYHNALEAWRESGNAGQPRNHAIYPSYEQFKVPYLMDIVGDQVVTFHKNWPGRDEEKKEIFKTYHAKRMTLQQVADAELTPTNCDFAFREIQSDAFKELGYHGPVGGGEARALRNLFTELGRTDLVRRGYLRVEKTVTRPPTKYQVRSAQWRNLPPPTPREVKAELMQYCYVFKSPLVAVTFDDFIKLARMYKSDKGGLRRAVQAVLANPEASNEVDTINAIDLLGKMVGMDGG